MPCDLMYEAEDRYRRGISTLTKFAREVSDITELDSEQVEALYGVEALFGRDAVVAVVKQVHLEWHMQHEPGPTVADFLDKVTPRKQGTQ